MWPQCPENGLGFPVILDISLPEGIVPGRGLAVPTSFVVSTNAHKAISVSATDGIPKCAAH